MKQPHSELPWFIDIEESTEEFVAIGSKEVIVADISTILPGAKEDSEYIVQAANMFPEAVELLKYFVQRVEEGSIRSNTTYAKYKDFLTKLEEDENT